jgi:ABC-type multidrug transport system ATPase subunit
MMEGFLEPSSGHAIIEGYSIQDDLDSIYCLMGACPQHDLLWEGLTGREHLLFYGRLKNLKGADLVKGVNDGLHSVNLASVGDELVSGYR